VILLLFAALTQLGTVPSEYVDLIEVNHQHDDCGNYTFTQIIAWDFARDTQKPHVRGWELVRNFMPQTANGVVRYESETMRIHSKTLRESWTQIDPERREGMRNADRYSLAKRGGK
jgi:hypothetical protein